MARIRRQCKSHKELESSLVLITPMAERPSLPSVTALTAAGTRPGGDSRQEGLIMTVLSL